MPNQAHMTMCEHLILFMLEHHKSRKQTEKALIDFLASLKYYAQKWFRARYFCIMCHFIKDVSPVDPGVSSDAPTFADIYQQEFYF